MTRFETILFKPNMSDISFIVGNEQEQIFAHKMLLATGSCVFQAMFYGPLASSEQEIIIPDVEPSGFRNLLKVLYIADAVITPDNVLVTLYAARKYAVLALEDQCIKFLENSLSAEEVFLVLSQATLYDVPRLIDSCLKFIDKNTEAALQSEQFLGIDKNTLETLLRRNTLQVKEITIFKAIIKWSKSACQKQQLPVTIQNQREVLQNCLSLVRFPLMTIEQFASGPAQSGILEQSQTIQQFLYFTLEPKPYTEFCEKRRCYFDDVDMVCKRYMGADTQWHYHGDSDRIRFTVNRTIFVTGLSLYNTVSQTADYLVSLKIVQLPNNVLTAFKTRVSRDAITCNLYRLMFDEYAEISPQYTYEIVANIMGPDTFYGINGSEKVVVQCRPADSVIFTFSNALPNYSNGTTVETGQIPEIHFCT